MHVLGNVTNRLDENIKSELETEFTETGFYRSIQSMKSNKSPGEDEILSECYQIYRYLIKMTFYVCYRLFL